MTAACDLVILDTILPRYLARGHDGLDSQLRVVARFRQRDDQRPMPLGAIGAHEILDARLVLQAELAGHRVDVDFQEFGAFGDADGIAIKRSALKVGFRYSRRRVARAGRQASQAEAGGDQRIGCLKLRVHSDIPYSSINPTGER